MKIEKITNHPMDVNTYVIIKDQECLVIDPSFNEKQLMQLIDRNGLKVEAVLLTHAHFDHLMSVNTICKTYDAPLYVHKKEHEFLYRAELNLSSEFMSGSGVTIDESIPLKGLNEEVKSIGSFEFNIYHVPGHSPGSVAIHVKELQTIITGDCLFHRSIGRTDLHGGDAKQLITSIKSKLWKLTPETIVYPGHGPSTTIGSEKSNNPYIR